MANTISDWWDETTSTLYDAASGVINNAVSEYLTDPPANTAPGIPTKAAASNVPDQQNQGLFGYSWQTIAAVATVAGVAFAIFKGMK